MNAFAAIRASCQRLPKTAVFWSFLVPLVRTAGFLCVMSLALRILPPADMGLWYVLINISMIGGAIEMGFNQTIGRFASYYMVGQDNVPALGVDSNKPSTGEPHYERIAGLVTTARRLYWKFGIVAGLNILIGGGSWLIWSGKVNLQSTEHVAAFLLMTIGSSVNMMTLYWHTLLNGINQVRLFLSLVVLGMVINYTVALTGLSVGLGLPAMVVGYILMSLIPRFKSRRIILDLIPEEATRRSVPLELSRLWPMTWRSGLSSFFSYLSLMGTTLVVAQVAGLEAAGSYGLCLQVGFLIHAFSASWHSVKLPQIAQWQSQRRFDDIRALVKRRMALSLITYVFCAVAAACLIPVLLDLIGSNTAPLPPAQLAVLFALIGLDFFVGLHAATIQTSNRMPYMPAFVFSGAVTIILALFLGSKWSIWGVLAAPFLAQIVWNYWWTPYLCWSGLRKQIDSGNNYD